MAFKGWPEDAVEFYVGLEADNSKSYWQQNKQVYEQKVRAPMEALLAELERAHGAGKIFRPYRDVRFSRDKSPYKTQVAATLERGGYIAMSAEGLSAGIGMYHMMKDQLDRYRKAVDADTSGDAIAKIVHDLEGKGMEVTAHDVLKSAPRGYDKEHPRIELLRLKGLIAWRQWPVGAWLGTARAKDRVVGFLKDAKPLMRWLDDNVGPSRLPSGR